MIIEKKKKYHVSIELATYNRDPETHDIMHDCLSELSRVAVALGREPVQTVHVTRFKIKS
jgi:hypothetical protein